MVTMMTLRTREGLRLAMEAYTSGNAGKAIAAVSVLLMAVSLFAAIDNVARKASGAHNSTAIEL